jgi:CRISPR system Cascade subunit CasB
MDDQMLMNFYEKWSYLKPGPKAELRRVRNPDEILDQPVFYRLVASLGWEKPWLEALARLAFCIPYITRSEGKHTLGAALGKTGKVSEKRIFQVIRTDYPNDIIQLRRVLQHIKPAVNWPSAARQLYFWHSKDSDSIKRNKRQLLEDFVLNQPKKTAA